MQLCIIVAAIKLMEGHDRGHMTQSSSVEQWLSRIFTLDEPGCSWKIKVLKNAFIPLYISV